MSEGFDYEAHRRNLQGNPDKALLVSFGYEAKKQKDGSFNNVEMIRIWLDKNSEVTRVVTDDDRRRFVERYDAWKRGEDAPTEGTPIGQCAFATPANVAACKAERIYTLEQLAETSDERLQRAQLVNFKYQAQDWLKSQKNSGYVGELREQIDQLKAQIEVLKERRVEPDEEEAPKPRRGRPPKVKNDDTQRPSE